MPDEVQCQHKGCTATSTMDMFTGVNVERGWTWWNEWGGITCPEHYAYGLAREREARRASDG